MAMPVRLLVALVLLLCLLPLWPSSAAQPGPGLDDFARLDTYLEQERAAAAIPGMAVVVVQRGRIVHARGFGNAGPSGRPMTPQTPSELGSVSKKRAGTKTSCFAGTP